MDHRINKTWLGINILLLSQIIIAMIYSYLFIEPGSSVHIDEMSIAYKSVYLSAIFGMLAGTISTAFYSYFVRKSGITKSIILLIFLFFAASIYNVGLLLEIWWNKTKRTEPSQGGW